MASSSPSPASNSEHSATQQLHPPPTPSPILHQNVKTENGTSDQKKENPTLIIKKEEQSEEPPCIIRPFQDPNGKKHTERYNKLEADYHHRLMAKYFSDKDFFGDSVFDGSKVINGDTIKMSRLHCAQSYADPIQYLKDKKARSSPPAETQISGSNAKVPIKKEEK